MTKTIKHLADELNVSKTAIRNYMDDDFRAKYTAKDSKGVITIDDEGCKLIAETLAKSAETDRKAFAETELVTIPRSVLTMLEEQLREKDAQIKDLTETVKAQAQSINADRHNELAGTLQHQLPERTDKKTIWGFWKRNKE